MHVQIIGTLTMLGIAVAATLCFLAPLCGSFPMCTDGQPPLMEANDAFPCARGCPRGFFCEMQDSLHTASIGICCANRTELRLLYGSDNKDHADPIWDGDPVPSTPKPSSLATTEVTTSTEATPSVRVIATATESRAPVAILIGETEARLNVTVRSRGNGLLPIVISDSDVIPEDSGPSTGLLSSHGAATGTDDAGIAGNAKIEELREERTRPVDPQDKLVLANETAPEATVPPPQSDTELLQTSDSGNLTVTDKDNTLSEEEISLMNITAPLETVENPDLTIVDSTKPSSTAEGANFGTNSSEGSMDSANREKQPEDNVQAEEKETKEEEKQENTAPTEETGTAEGTLEVVPGKKEEVSKGSPENPNTDLASVAAEPVDVNAPSDVTEVAEKPLNEQDSVKISDIEKGDQAQEGEEEKQIRYSCERQAYEFSCHSGSVLTQPTIRWYLNERGECEYYPWGYCPGDRVVESSTIRTKLECMRECMRNSTNPDGGSMGVAHKATETPGEAIAKFSNSSVSSEEKLRSDIGKDEEQLESQNSQEGEGAPGGPQDANVTVASVTSAPLETTISEGVATSTPAEASAENDSEEKEDVKMEGVGLPEDPESIQEEGTTVATMATNLTTDNSTVIIREKKAEGGSVPTLSEQGVHPRPTEQEGMQESTGIASEEGNPLDNQVSEAVESSSIPSTTEREVETIENREQRPNLSDGETTDGITYETTMKPRENVLCTPSPYRFICKRGMPSQFVYRWSKANDGRCQSFPYGYCLTEWNHPHPRTPEECERYCN